MTTRLNRWTNGILTAAMATAFLAVAATADAQYTEHWRLEVSDASFIGTNLARDMGYNPVTDTLLIPHREAGVHVARIAALDGTILLPGLDTTGVAGGTFAINTLAAVDLGGDSYSVYVSNLTTNVNTAALRIYRWHSDGSTGVVTEDTLGAPTVVYSNRTASGADPAPIGPPLPDTTKSNPRVGDHMGASHIAGLTTLYMSVGTAGGDTADLIYTITINEVTGTVTAVNTVTTLGQTGDQTWGAAADAAGNIYNMTSGGARYFTPAGTEIHAFPTTEVGANSARPSPMLNGGRSFFGFIERTGTPLGSTIRILEVTDGVELATEFLVSAQATSPLANNAAMGGGVALDIRERFVGFVGNNLIVSFSDESPLLISLADLSAKVNEPSGTVTVSWETASEIDNVGFNVYRVSSNAATPELVNPVIIPSAGDGASYSLVDSQVLAPGETRGYILEDVDANNVKTTHGPVIVTRGGSASTVSEWPQF